MLIMSFASKCGDPVLMHFGAFLLIMLSGALHFCPKVQLWWHHWNSRRCEETITVLHHFPSGFAATRGNQGGIMVTHNAFPFLSHILQAKVWVKINVLSWLIFCYRSNLCVYLSFLICTRYCFKVKTLAVSCWDHFVPIWMITFFCLFLWGGLCQNLHKRNSKGEEIGCR